MSIHFEIRINDQATTESLETFRQQWKDYLLQSSSLSSIMIDENFFVQAPSHLMYGGHYTIHTEGTTVSSLLLSPTTVTNTSTSQIPSFQVHVYILNHEEPAMEELEPTEGEQEWTVACEHWTLPHISLHTAWESLFLEGPIQSNLLHFASSALLFADKHVSSHLVHWNRMILFHGPPGTGKTSLCRALANKLSIRMNQRFTSTSLLEIHSHSLFSKWFSTSGKLIHRLFDLIQEMLQEDPNRLICVFIDEMESLAANRSSMISGSHSSEPTDALRAVNSMLTGLDRLRNFPNVLLLATTNITQAVDDAFMDRVDWNVYMGPPCFNARCAILRSSLQELQRVGIVSATVHNNNNDNNNNDDDMERMLLSLALRADGLSGRSLRRLPLQAYALLMASFTPTPTTSMTTMTTTITTSSSSTKNDDETIPSVILFLKALDQAIENELLTQKQKKSIQNQ